MTTYFGHPVTIVRRGRKNTRVKFSSGRTKVVPNLSLKTVPLKAS